MKEIVQALLDTGLTEDKLTKLITEKGVSCSQPTIHRLKTGKVRQPMLELGLAIIQLHKELVLKKEEDSQPAL